ncbi:hypothetical protein CEXT_627561 [Caerostris extrusa]|uniref:Uncharacterized protein n=1 Tax=Caerostris extrusa TaxID=172846 RepID=A0AAV4U8I6_CAEEX|nr:hypothetical protein CEXT_627561 [Caerostris extrusa]
MVHALSALRSSDGSVPGQTRQGFSSACQSASLGKCAQYGISMEGKTRVKDEGRRGNKIDLTSRVGSPEQTFIAGEDSHNLKVEELDFSLSLEGNDGFWDLLKYK